MRRLVSAALTILAAAAAPGAWADEPRGQEDPAARPGDPVNSDPTSPPIEAQTQEEALATELFNAARELMAEGKHAEACPKLVESARLAQKVGTLGKLAECEEKLGQLVRARARFQQALNLARAQNDERLPIVERELARIDAKVPKLIVSLEGPLPAGLGIKVDGVELGAGSAGMALPLDPGRHSVAASAPGKKPFTASVSLKADGTVTKLLVPALDDAAAKSEAAADSGGRRGVFMGLGIASAGLGAAALGVGAALGVRAQGKLDQSYELGCTGNRCTPEGAAIRDEARGAGNASTALFIAGGVLAAGGVGFILAAPAAKTSAKVEARVSPAGGALSIQGRW